MIIRARAPLRLGLAGGGTDVSPFCDLHGGYVLNAALSQYAYAIVELREKGEVEFAAADRTASFQGSAEEALVLALDGPLALHKGVYQHIVKNFNGGRPFGASVTTFCDVPAGSGLGASSTIVVALLEAFREVFTLPLGEYDLANLAYRIERNEIGLSGGRQDQYAATFGGFNFMEFHANGHIIVNPLRIRHATLTELEASMVLYFTGVSRDSAAIIDEQAANVRQGDSQSIEAMHRLKGEALTMKDALLRGDVRRLGEILNRGWAAKKQTAQNISNLTIDRTYDLALAAGAYAGKVSGAGGGGFMMFLVDPVKREAVVRALQAQGGQVMPCHFTKHGSEAWRVR